MEQLYTEWKPGEIPLDAYPRPQMRRKTWTNLNGTWDYAISDTADTPPVYYGKILVPFAPETALSGVGETPQPGEFMHYRRTFTLRDDGEPGKNEAACPENGSRLLLHFEAVDYICDVQINGKEAGRHTGGYTPFTFDITDLVVPGSNTLTLTAQDPSDTGWQSRGKQKLRPGGMFYRSTSGIWQTVWLETVPRDYIKAVKITPDTDRSAVFITVFMHTGKRCPVTVSIFQKESDPAAADKTNAQADYSLWEKCSGSRRIISAGGTAGRKMRIPIRNPHLWSPDDPFLYGLKISAGEDTVRSYFAMRKFSSGRDTAGHLRFCLNNVPLFMNGVLDQGYWPESGMTAPADAALIFDIQKMKELGFNMLRKHVKIESRRWYWHCDRLGMLVMQDMPNGGAYRYLSMTVLPNIFEPWKRIIPDHALLFSGRKSAASRKDYCRDLRQMMLMLYNSPSVAVWVPFNEGWGQSDAGRVTSFLQRYDPTRLIDQASGWFDQWGGDFFSIHNYFHVLRLPVQRRRIVAVTEYGGMVLRREGHLAYPDKAYGYGEYRTAKALTRAYWHLIRRDILRGIPQGLSASVFTQLSDIEEESNGILTWDRKCVKMDEEKLKEINRKIFEKWKKISG